MVFSNPLTQFKQWWVRNSELHTNVILFFIMFTYAAQGGRGYMGTTFTNIATYELKAGASQITVKKATGLQPWNFKFLMGLVSDNLPLFGFNLKPYFVFASILGFVGVAMLGVNTLTPNLESLGWAYFMMEFYGAFSDCLADALVVKNGKNDEEDSSSGLQSLSWFWYAMGSAIFGVTGAYMSTDASMEDQVSTTGSRWFNIISIAWPIGLLAFQFVLKEERSSIVPGFTTLLKQLIKLFVALLSPPFLVLRVAVWIVISGASV